MKPEPTSKLSLWLTMWPTLSLTASLTTWRRALSLLLIVGATSVVAQTTPPENEQPLSSEEILALFEREANAAYAIAKETCEPLSGQEAKQCLAQARLQYDADRRYARKRAEQGY
jgi:hypothetical protein